MTIPVCVLSPRPHSRQSPTQRPNLSILIVRSSTSRLHRQSESPQAHTQNGGRDSKSGEPALAPTRPMPERWRSAPRTAALPNRPASRPKAAPTRQQLAPAPWMPAPATRRPMPERQRSAPQPFPCCSPLRTRRPDMKTNWMQDECLASNWSSCQFPSPALPVTAFMACIPLCCHFQPRGICSHFHAARPCERGRCRSPRGLREWCGRSCCTRRSCDNVRPSNRVLIPILAVIASTLRVLIHLRHHSVLIRILIRFPAEAEVARGPSDEPCEFKVPVNLPRARSARGHLEYT